MMKTIVIAIIGVLGSFKCTEGAVTAWTNPQISGASGSGAATPAVPENTAVGTTGVTIAATAGTGLTYAILSQPTVGKLSIDASTGLLSLVAGNSFDFETEPTYILQITCTESSASSTGTATVTLSITDITGDPAFASEPYAATIADGATQGTSLINITATPAVAQHTITYRISDGNTNSDFAIAGTTGAITVATGKTLNRTITSKYTLKVTALDGPLAAVTTVQVTVNALNSGTTSVFVSVMTIAFAMVTAVI